MLNVILVGLVSCFADISSDMVYPIVPIFLATKFGATPATIGVIEGIAESLASLLKTFSGHIADKYNQKKPIVFIGYLLGVFYKIGLIFSTSWLGVLFARMVDRTGKGLRVAPRDLMVSESVNKRHLGNAYGIHKMLDMVGSAFGILIAYFLVKTLNGSEQFTKVFLWSTVPAMIGLFIFAVLVKDKTKGKPARPKPIPFWKNIHRLDSRLKLYLLVVFIFTLGNSSNAFLLLRAQDVGFSAADAILLYFLYHVSAAIFAVPFGRMSDKKGGRKRVLVLGYALFSMVYFSLAAAPGDWMMVVSFIVLGLYTAATTGVERAFVAEIAPRELRGTMLGLQATVAGVALLPASVLFGLLWNQFGPVVSFAFGGVMSAIAALVLLFFLSPKQDRAKAFL